MGTMRQKIPLQTYSRRTMRLHARRSGARRIAGLSALVIAVLGAGSLAAYALVGPGSSLWTAGSDTAREERISATARTAASAASETTAPRSATTSPPAASEPTAPADPSRPATITIAGVGDMLFDRQVKKLIESRGGEAPLARVAERLARADVTVGNLETTLASGGKRNPVKEPKYAFRGHPDGVAGLKLAGFDAVSIANNHMLDYGWDPLRDTISSLRAAGIGTAGAGKNTDEAWTPATIETTQGARVAFLAFSHILPPGFLAGEDRPGIASGRMDRTLVVKAIRDAKKSHDYVIVSYHWGVEYEDDANGDQVRWARETIDAGADMVLAHHPHVIQGVEFYKGRLIAYSLGDFVFDHYSRKTGEAFILEAELGPDGTPEALAVPVYLDDTYGHPKVVKGSHADEILTRLKKISGKHGTSVVISGSTARLLP